MCKVELSVSSVAGCSRCAQVCGAAGSPFRSGWSSRQPCPLAGGGREGQQSARWFRPPRSGDPGGLSPPSLWGGSVWTFPWKWGQNPVPLGLEKVRGDGRAVSLWQESCSSAGNCQADEQTVITRLSRPDHVTEHALFTWLIIH